MFGPAVFHNAILPGVRASNIHVVAIHSDSGLWFPLFDVIRHGVPVLRIGLIYSGHVGPNFVVVRHVGIWVQADIGSDAVPAFGIPSHAECSPLAWVERVLVVDVAVLLLPQMRCGWAP